MLYSTISRCVLRIYFQRVRKRGTQVKKRKQKQKPIDDRTMLSKC